MFNITFGVGRTYRLSTDDHDTARLLVDALTRTGKLNVKINNLPPALALATGATNIDGDGDWPEVGADTSGTRGDAYPELDTSIPRSVNRGAW